MVDILIRDVPGKLKKQIEQLARGHRRSLSGEIKSLLETAVVRETRGASAGSSGGLGSRIGALVSEADWVDFVQPRDQTERPAPDFE